jgi:hypothetical protein
MRIREHPDLDISTSTATQWAWWGLVDGRWLEGETSEGSRARCCVTWDAEGQDVRLVLKALEELK